MVLSLLLPINKNPHFAKWQSFTQHTHLCYWGVQADLLRAYKYQLQKAVHHTHFYYASCTWEPMGLVSICFNLHANHSRGLRGPTPNIVPSPSHQNNKVCTLPAHNYAHVPTLLPFTQWKRGTGAVWVHSGQAIVSVWSHRGDPTGRLHISTAEPQQPYSCKIRCSWKWEHFVLASDFLCFIQRPKLSQLFAFDFFVYTLHCLHWCDNLDNMISWQ